MIRTLLHRSRRPASALLLLVALAGAGTGGQPGEEPAQTGPDAGFSRADRPLELSLPAFLGAHPSFRTEWWYLTGALEDPRGGLYGVQATWFRNALAATLGERESALATRDLVLFHGGLTDVSAGTFRSASRVSRAASTWAGAKVGGLDVWLLGDRLRQQDDVWNATFTVGDRRVELRLRPSREPLLHGEIPGWSRKGPDPAESSYYASWTRIEAEGTIRTTTGDDEILVRGRLWFDREVFSQQLAADQVGWDWFSVALDDGTDLMAFRLRERGGAEAPTSSGTLRLPDGTRRHLAREAVDLEVTATWASPAAGPDDPPYPAGWRLTVPSAGLELRIEPLVADQEHRPSAGEGPIYWEGLCRFTGTRAGVAVEGLGYAELVGYRGERPRGM